MERYIWSINDIKQKIPGAHSLDLWRTCAFKFVNETMMTHPMHLRDVAVPFWMSAPVNGILLSMIKRQPRYNHVGNQSKMRLASGFSIAILPTTPGGRHVSQRHCRRWAQPLTPAAPQLEVAHEILYTKTNQSALSQHYCQGLVVAEDPKPTRNARNAFANILGRSIRGV